MKAEEILKLADLESRIADAVSYTCYEKGDVLMVNKQGEFAKVEAHKVSGRKYQGWTECLCTENLHTLIGDDDTSDDGLEEARKIVAWMREQK